MPWPASMSAAPCTMGVGMTYSRFLQGTDIRSNPSELATATYSCTRAPSVLRPRLSAITSAPTSTAHLTSLTASATNSITYNYVTAHEPGNQPVRDGSPGLN